MKVCLAKKSWLSMQNLRVHCFPNSNVLGELEERALSWRFGSSYFIVAPTGSGKSHFVEQVLIAKSMRQHGQILYVSNRTANSVQAKRRLAQLEGCEAHLENYSSLGIRKMEEIGDGVIVVTYQRLIQLCQSGDALLRFRMVNYAIFDECHFFASDSLFNPYTGLLLEKILELFAHAVRLYMTATPDDSFESIMEAENRNGVIPEIWRQYQNSDYRQLHTVYLFEPGAVEYSPFYFSDVEEIVSEIRRTPPIEKWMIFVHSKELGRNIEAQVSSDCVFLDASAKEDKGEQGEIYQHILEHEQCPKRVLITTAVLDNGVNLNDDQLKHIVIFSTDRTQYLQALGRKRVKKGEEPLVYLYAGSKVGIARRIHWINQRIQAIYDWQSNRSKFVRRFYEGDGGQYEIVRGLFYHDAKQNVMVNPLAKKKLFADKSWLTELGQLLEEDDHAFIKAQLEWLNLGESYSSTRWLTQVPVETAQSDLEAFLSQSCGRVIEKGEIESFCERFTELAKAAYGRRKNDRADRGIYKITVIRKVLGASGLPYQIKVSGGNWTLERS